MNEKDEDVLMVKVVSEGQKNTVDVQASANTITMLGMIARARMVLDDIENNIRQDVMNDKKAPRV